MHGLIIPRSHPPTPPRRRLLCQLAMLAAGLLWLQGCDRGTGEGESEPPSGTGIEPAGSASTVGGPARVSISVPVAWLEPEEVTERQLEAAVTAEEPGQDVLAARVWYLLHPDTRAEGNERARLRREREAAAAQARQEALEGVPHYGRLSVSTTPSYARVRLDGFPAFAPHPNQEGLIETRSRTTFENLRVEAPHHLTVTLPNYLPLEIEIAPAGSADSPWVEGRPDFRAVLTLTLEPEPERAAELAERLRSDGVVPELNGEITVRTEPPGARVRYNGRLLVDEGGHALTTPLTFDHYPPPESLTGEPSDAEPLPVTLRRVGVPITVELDGFHPVHTGVYAHMFTCEPVSGTDPAAPLWEGCHYVYDTGVIALTPEIRVPSPTEAP